MPVFKILGGRYLDRKTGITHAANDPATEVVESDDDLVKIWGANKFQRIDYAQPLPKKLPAEARAPLTTEQKLCGHKFEPQSGNCIKCGAGRIQVQLAAQPKRPPHTKPQDQPGTNGEAVVTPAPKAQAQARQRPSPAPEPEDAPEAPAQNDYGTDVTDQFPTAQEMGMNVYRRDNEYTVTNADDGVPINSQPLSRKQVPTFIEDQA